MKDIHAYSDLAINGAVPAFDEPLHVGKPNVGERALFEHYVDELFKRGRLSNNGPLVQELERKVAGYHSVKHCVAMCNGTVALEIAIRALGMEGEVIIPSYTFIATAHALHWQGLIPVFADIDPRTHTLDPNAIKRMITPRTTGLIGVHLWGRPAHIGALEEIAEEYHLELMFDAAHAFGCSYQGRMIGGFGRCEVLSFHATKVFNTFEGGAVLTNDDELAETMRLMRNFGFSGADNVILPGTNGKMTEISAAMGVTNLKSIKKTINANRAAYRRYRDGLARVPGIKVLTFDEGEYCNFQYVVVEVAEDCAVTRDQLIEALQVENILARKYFWPGCHKMKPYVDDYPHAGLLLENSQHVSERVVVLPTGASLSEETIQAVVSVISVMVESEKTVEV